MRPSMTTTFRYWRKGPRLEPPDKLRDEPANQVAPELKQNKPSPTAQPSPTPFGTDRTKQDQQGPRSRTSRDTENQHINILSGWDGRKMKQVLQIR